MWQFLKQLLIELLFPKYCVGCGKLFFYICRRCYNKIHFFATDLEINLEEKYIDKIFVACFYAPPISKLIHTFKYQGVIDIGRYLGQFLYYTTSIPEVDYISFVPIHKKRLQERGFNQTQLIAENLARCKNIPVCDCLKKVVHTSRQAQSKNRQERLQKMRGSFAVQTKQLGKINNASILIIDDVLTTGATLNECAKILKQSGVKQVFGLAVASRT